MFNEKLKPKIFKSKPLESELNPISINLLHDGIITENNDILHIEYEVKGTVFSIETNTRLEVCKRFGKLSDAEIYFKKIIKEFPKSEIILKSINIKELKIYV